MPKKNQKESSRRKPKAVSRPLGVKLVSTLRGHVDRISRIAWSPDGRMIASSSQDETIRLWDVDTGECLRTLTAHTGPVLGVAFDPLGRTLASGSHDKTVKLWDVASGKLIRSITATDVLEDVAFDSSGRTIAGGVGPNAELWQCADGKLLRSLRDNHSVLCVAFDQGRTLATGNIDGSIKLWDSHGNEQRRELKGHENGVLSLTFDPVNHTLVSTSADMRINVWNVTNGKLRNTIEGHIGYVRAVAFSPEASLLVSQGTEGDIRIWNWKSRNTVAILREVTGDQYWCRGLAFHPRLPLLATVGSDLKAPEKERDRIIHIWNLDVAVLLDQVAAQSVHYVNAKVMLVGDTGVGKSGLSLVLNGKPFCPTDSTPGRRVWTFQSRKVKVDKNIKQTRETLLWDLAGQPGYRVIHQLHLNEVAVALVVFDARSETDPLAGVRHWERALRLGQQRQGSSAVPLKKFLVSARADRGTVSVSKERLEVLLKEFGFDGYFETSAKEGWKIKELQQAIKESIPWDALPEVSSSVLFADIKSFLLNVKRTGRLVAHAAQLYDDFAGAHPDSVAKESNLREQFDTCIGRLENRDLIRRLSFGGYVLLQPELLDAYASAMVNAAKKEPDGLGSIAEDIALAGQFYIPDEQKVKDRGQQQLLLHATVEELVKHDLALRESASDGRYLVFPSEFIRDYEAAPEPRGKALAITFDGPVQGLYSTLAVRLGHSGLFTTGRSEMWRNAAIFTARAGGKCGLYLHEFEEARGRLVIFYDRHEGRFPSNQTRFHFEEFVLAHARRHALNGTVELVRFFVCVQCGNPVPDNYVKILRQQDQKTFDCPCRAKVSLEEPEERLRFASEVEAMERSADRQRDFEMFVESARGETSTPSFAAWADDDRVMLAIVFTDVVGSTALGQELGDARMNELRRAHFAQSRKLIEQYKGREIKTIGDSFMAAFRSVGKALDYAVALQGNPGHEKVEIRAGIHIGSMTVEENDVFGGTVNFAARVVGAIKGPEIWLSNQAKEDLVSGGAKQHVKLEWKQRDGVEMKGFNGTFTLWSLSK